MIKGNLGIISIPGLLQLLANESAPGYRIVIENNSQKAQVDVIKGELVNTKFGILEGVDALAEIISWTEGQFEIIELTDPPQVKPDSMSHCNLEELGSFQDQCSFLRQINVGLSTELIPSSNFGQEEWQEALYVQPLGKSDYTVLGWITDGRTMRQAMSELTLDIRTAIGILYRLILTGSVEVVKAGPNGESDFKNLISKRMEKLANRKVGLNKGATIVSIKDSKSEKDKASNVVSSKSASTSGSRSDTSDLIEKPERKSIFDAKDTDTQELPTVGSAFDEEFTDSLLESPLTKMVSEEVEKEEREETKEVSLSSLKVESSPFEMKKTDPLPLVSIDIERLMNTNFKLTSKGSEQLEEVGEDDMVGEVLRGVKLGKALVLVLTDSNRSDASVMATYRYCLDNGMIEHHDQVVQLTIDLVLDKIDLIQYLLQRRRVTGEQLKELTTISTRQGIEIIKLLIGSGAVLPADLERLKQEKERFSPK